MRSAIILPIALFTGSLFAPLSSAWAITTPTFPTCSNPQGVVKVNYSQGTHGIVGSTATFNGSDAVYTLTDNTLMQCFCAEDGAGIQSNWWKISSSTQADINALVDDGWTFVPDGSLWGLADTPYLVKNNNFACKASTQGGTGGGAIGGSGDGRSDGLGGLGGGQILAAATEQILGLASTGNSTTPYIFLILGLLFFIAGCITTVKNRN